jgi:hypothetical protein
LFEWLTWNNLASGLCTMDATRETLSSTTGNREKYLDR